MNKYTDINKGYNAGYGRIEDQSLNIFDNMADGVQLLDFNCRYLYVNDAWLKQGTYSRNELIGFTITEKYPEIENSALLKEIQGCLSCRKASQLEYELNNPDGTKAVFELRLQPIPEGILILSIDITERKKAEAENVRINAELEKKLLHRTTELQAISKELEAFSYSISHDLRAPLRAVNGFSDMLAQQYNEQFDDNAKRLLSVIKSNAVNMGQLIDDLLQFSRTGRKEITPSEVDMNNLVFSAASELTNNDPDKMSGIAFKPLPPAFCDMQLIRQVWTNLISNALKFSAKKEKIEIEVGATENETGITYYIKDNGAGFDMQYSSKLFGMFQRLHSNKEFEGNGVGLAISQRIIIKHGGKIWADAAIDKGATFYFGLPKITN